MAHQIIYKKRFLNKLLVLLDYLKNEWSDKVADVFLIKLQSRFQTISAQPHVGAPSATLPSVRSLLITKHNRIFYRIKGNTIEVINMYDTRMNPKKNRYW